MLNHTILLFAVAMVLHAAAAAGAWWGYLIADGRRWAWLCLLVASLFSGVRSALPFWMALNVGLYDFRDALLTLLSAAFILATVIGLLGARR